MDFLASSGLAPFGKEPWVCLPMLVATAGDRAVTVRDRARRSECRE